MAGRVIRLLLALSLSAPVAGQNVDLNDMRVRVQTRAREMTIGRQASRRFERQTKLFKNATVQAYVDGIAQNVARNSDCMVPVTIKIVDSDEVNAFSFPGGFLYLTRGLILAVDDDAEIAAVIAHEIAHVVARDGMKNSRYLGTASGLSPIIVAPSGEVRTSDLGGYLIPLRVEESPREIEADGRGIQYLEEAGYNPHALLRFLLKMQAKEQTELENVFVMFQTHPPTAERIRLVRERIGTGSTDQLNANTAVELKQIKAELLISGGR
jgi:beta-barrel assembly-enhancing protease